MNLANPSSPPARRRWGQFSLTWLLVVVIAGCLLAAWFGEKRRRETAEQRVRLKEEEIRELRIALGILDDQPDVLKITDQSQVYLHTLPPRDELEWRWRVFVPPGKGWYIETSYGNRWDEERKMFSGGGGGSSLKLSGEFTLTARIVRNLEGRAYLEIGHGHRSLGATMPEEGVAVLRGNGKLTHEIAGAKQQVSFAPQGQIQLLRWHREAKDQGASAAAASESGSPKGFGFLIRIEEETHYMARIRGQR